LSYLGYPLPAVSLTTSLIFSRVHVTDSSRSLFQYRYPDLQLPSFTIFLCTYRVAGEPLEPVS
jgi:hypothetical protein